jgi:hypothetical protein
MTITVTVNDGIQSANQEWETGNIEYTRHNTCLNLH